MSPRLIGVDSVTVGICKVVKISLDYVNRRNHLSFGVDALGPSVAPNAGAQNIQVHDGYTISSYVNLFQMTSNVKSITSTHQNPRRYSLHLTIACGRGEHTPDCNMRCLLKSTMTHHPVRGVDLGYAISDGNIKSIGDLWGTYTRRTYPAKGIISWIR
ncbi:hypothetical protein BDR06DRAFT_971170 [Suillus hirtellus]|nr:hypothetical protein BDR06DRAFT_971170 [Suillus hirtellus]